MVRVTCLSPTKSYFPLLQTVALVLPQSARCLRPHMKTYNKQNSTSNKSKRLKHTGRTNTHAETIAWIPKMPKTDKKRKRYTLYKL